MFIILYYLSKYLSYYYLCYAIFVFVNGESQLSKPSQAAANLEENSPKKYDVFKPLVRESVLWEINASSYVGYFLLYYNKRNNLFREFARGVGQSPTWRE